MSRAGVPPPNSAASHQRPSQVQVSVVLPGEADAAVDLDVEFGVARIGRQRQRRGHGGGQAELLLILGSRARGIPYRGDPRLGGHQHVRAMVFHRLECRDGTTELLAHLGVLDGGVHAVGRPAHRLGGQQRPRPGQRRFPCPRHDVVGGDAHPLQADAPGTPGRVEVLRHLDRHTGAAGFQQQDVIAGGNHQQVGEPGAEHDPGLTGGDPIFDLHAAVQADTRGDRSVGESRQHSRLLFRGAVFGDHRRRDHGRYERAGRHRAAELLDHHHEFGQPIARTAVLLVDVQTQPTELDQVLPEAGPRLVGGVEERPRRPARLLRGQERAGHLGEFAMVVGQCDTHKGLLALQSGLTACPAPRGSGAAA